MGRLYGLLESRLLKECSKRWPSRVVIWQLIKRGANINCYSKRGPTPLIRLCLSRFDNHICRCIHTLLNARNQFNRKLIVDINAKDSRGNNALLLLLRLNCLTKSQLEIFKLLLRRGIDVNHRVDDSPLQLVCRNYFHENVVEIMKLLIKNGGNVDVKDESGRTLLHTTCSRPGLEGVLEMISLLIRRGVDINCKDCHDEVAVDHLYMKYSSGNLLEVTRLLLENGSDVSRKRLYFCLTGNEDISEEVTIQICMALLTDGGILFGEEAIAFAIALIAKFILPLKAFAPANIFLPEYLVKDDGDPDVKSECMRHQISISHLCRTCFAFVDVLKRLFGQFGINCEELSDEEMQVWHQHETHDHLIGYVKLAEESCCDLRVCHPLLECIPFIGIMVNRE